MHGAPEAGTPFRQHRHHLARLRFSVAADAKVLGTATQAAAALHPWLSLTCNPGIEDMLQEDVCQHG
jgi:hypothetical protein